MNDFPDIPLFSPNILEFLKKEIECFPMNNAERRERVVKAANVYQRTDVSMDKAGREFGVSGEAVRQYISGLQRESGKKIIKPGNRHLKKYTEDDLLRGVELYKSGRNVKESSKLSRVPEAKLGSYLRDQRIMRETGEAIRLGQRLKNREGKRKNAGERVLLPTLKGTGLKRKGLDVFGLIPQEGQK